MATIEPFRDDSRKTVSSIRWLISLFGKLTNCIQKASFPRSVSHACISEFADVTKLRVQHPENTHPALGSPVASENLAFRSLNLQASNRQIASESGATGLGVPVRAVDGKTEMSVTPSGPAYTELAVSDSSERSDVDRGKTRSAWLEAHCTAKQWTSNAEITRNGGPTYNTIKRYQSGKKSTRDRYVRLQFANAFSCEFADVPE